MVNGDAQASPKIAIDGETVLEPSYLQKSNGRIVLSPERIKQLVIEYMRATLENDEKCRALTGGGTMSLDGMTLLESSNMKADESRAIMQSVSRWLSQGDHSLMHSLTEKILTSEKAEIDPQSETYKVLSRELLKAFRSVLQVRIRRSEGDYSIPDEELVPVLKQVAQEQPIQTSGAVLPAPKEPASLPFTEVQARYIAEVEKGENWTEKTKAENLSIQVFSPLRSPARGKAPSQMHCCVHSSAIYQYPYEYGEVHLRPNQRLGQAVHFPNAHQ
ncbi:MAG TPA: hypothetical protein DDY32_02955 [Desulfobulbaceae bacterium]|nr:hypothetical protein [Desulfobulbaceae bacterium]